LPLPLRVEGGHPPPRGPQKTCIRLNGEKKEKLRRQETPWVDWREETSSNQAQLVALDKKCGCSTFKEENKVVAFKDSSSKRISRVALPRNAPLGIATCHQCKSSDGQSRKKKSSLVPSDFFAWWVSRLHVLLPGEAAEKQPLLL